MAFHLSWQLAANVSSTEDLSQLWDNSLMSNLSMKTYSRYIYLLTFERVMVSPVRKNTTLDLFIETLLHAIHILQFVGLNPLILTLFSSLDSLFNRGSPHFTKSGTALLCHFY